MNIRNIFIIIIRVLALSLFIKSLSSIAGQIGFLLTFDRAGDMITRNIFFVFISQTLLALLFFWIAPRLVDRLKLTKHLDSDKLDLGSLNMSSIIKFSIIIISSLLIINNVPLLIIEMFKAPKVNFLGEFTIDNNSVSWLSFVLKIFIAVMLFRNSDRLSNYISRKTEE